MDLYRFQLLAGVVKHRTVTKAAQELHISQPALSQQLKLLQERFGSLLHKRGRGVELSKRGEAFYKRIQPILAEIESVRWEYELRPFSQTGTVLRIGSSYGPATSLLPSVVNAFKREYPATEIHLRVLNSPDTEELLKNSELDLAVVTNPIPTESIQMEPFKTFQICLFASSTHPLAQESEIPIETLENYPLVIGRAKKARGRTDELLRSIAASGVRLNVLMRCEWPDAVKSIVRQGEAVGVLYRDSVEQAVRAGAFKILNVIGVNLSVISYILYSREKSLSQAAQEFLRLLRAAAKGGSGRSLLHRVQHYLFLLFAALAGLPDSAFTM